MQLSLAVSFVAAALAAAVAARAEVTYATNTRDALPQLQVSARSPAAAPAPSGKGRRYLVSCHAGPEYPPVAAVQRQAAALAQLPVCRVAGEACTYLASGPGGALGIWYGAKRGRGDVR